MALSHAAPAPSNSSANTPSDFDARKVTTPVLLHLLRGKQRFPLLFLLKCKMTVGRFRKTIDPRFPAELVDMCALPLWVYINLKSKVGQSQAFEIMRIAILSGGIAQWNFAYRAADERRSFEKLCDEEIRVNRTGPTRWNTDAAAAGAMEVARLLIEDELKEPGAWMPEQVAKLGPFLSRLAFRGLKVDFAAN